ncbi:MAG TPA: MBL fold metallo-hydrolase [Candidatus Marinimicrobia bacterium]|nr:MBL fold metallo-hydrolase [Candidatus Neomarinimicrobiota bacterium]
MKIKFWGVRGSIPTPPTSEQIEQKMRMVLEKAAETNISTPEKRELFLRNMSFVEAGLIGGNTACVTIEANNTLIILDMGSGLVRLGNELIEKQQNNGGLDIHIFMSHTHWDHIMGWPLFKPAFYSQNKITFYSVHADFEERLNLQQDFRFFPVSLSHMASQKKFVVLEPDSEITIKGISIRNTLQYHPGKSYAYRVTYGNKSMVYATDSEYKTLDDDLSLSHVNFFRNADLLIFDAMYTFEEAIHKEDWGHSSALLGIDLSVQANVKNLALFHHEPDKDDFTVQSMLHRSLNYKKINYPKAPLDVFLAYEGLELKL